MRQYNDEILRISPKFMDFFGFTKSDYHLIII